MKTHVALALFWFGIFTLTFFAGAIIFRLIIWPPCTLAGTACIIDSWSVAGLASTVLGIAATMLGILGAVAVAAWWVGLNKRVTKRVTKLFTKWKAELDKEVKGIFEEKEKEINEQFKTFEAKFQDMDKKVIELDEKLKNAEQQTSNIIELVLKAALINPPDQVETWARFTMKNFDVPQIPRMMCLVYLDYVDRLLTDNQSELLHFMTELAKSHMPSNIDYYWDNAQQWQIIADNYYTHAYKITGQLPLNKHIKWTEISAELQEQINIRKQKIEAKTHQQKP